MIECLYSVVIVNILHKKQTSLQKIQKVLKLNYKKLQNKYQEK